MTKVPLSVAIVVPTYNEAGNIQNLFQKINENVASIKNTVFKIFIIDDSSPDGTAAVAIKTTKTLTAPNLSVKVLVKKKKEGLGKAYTWGFKKVMAEGFYDYILEMDADLSHDPVYLKDFAREAHSKQDIVVASRYIKGGSTPDWSRYRKFLSKFGNYYVRLFLGSRFTDWTGGYNMYSTDLLQRIKLEDLSTGYTFQLELKNRALKKATSTGEIPIIFPDRQEGESKIPADTMKKTLAMVPKLAFQNNFTKSRIVKALIFAAVVAGFAVLTALTFLYMAGNPDPNKNWPVNFELSYMDNPFLWIMARDVSDGARILFESSGQAFLFPEIPVSLVAYWLSDGSIHWYYLVVATINNTLLFLLIFLIVNNLFYRESFANRLFRTVVSTLPLIVAMFATKSLIYYLHLAPTYNFDLYFGIFLLPFILSTKRKRSRIIATILFVMTAMSNMLTIVFTLPVVFVVAIVVFMKYGIKRVLPILTWATISVALAGVLNYIFFKIQHGISMPFSIHTSSKQYIDFYAVGDRMDLVVNNLEQAANGNRPMIISMFAILACMMLALYYARVYFRSDRKTNATIGTIAKMSLALLPIAGTISAYMLTLLYDYYMWPAIVGSIIVCLILLPPKKIVPYATFGSVIILTGSLLVSVENIAASKQRYFNYRTPITQCIDRYIPYGSYVYARNSTGKISSSQTTKNIKLVQVAPDYTPSKWLNNIYEIDDQSTQVHFIVFDDQKNSDYRSYMNNARQLFGNPNEQYLCEDSIGEIWYFDSNINKTTSTVNGL
jgi:dolichol-phosphate mannosyltransferase